MDCCSATLQPHDDMRRGQAPAHARRLHRCRHMRRTRHGWLQCQTHQHPCKRSTRDELLRKTPRLKSCQRNTLHHTTHAHTRHSISNMMLPAARQRPAAACTGSPPTAKSLRCTRHLASRLQHSSCHKHSGYRLCRCRPSPSTHTHTSRCQRYYVIPHTTEENPGLHKAASMI